MDSSGNDQDVVESYDAGQPVTAIAQKDGVDAEKFIETARDRPPIVPLLIAFGFGLAAGYLLWGLSPASRAASPATTTPESTLLAEQVNPPAGYTIRISFRDVGPRLLAAGAIDYDRFVQTYDKAGRPLTNAQITILTKGSDAPIVINRENAYFLLNFFWAVGLTNRNPVLTDGPMMKYSQGKVGQFASTGGWTIGSKPATELYASTPIITLTAEQQKRLEEVASAVYRPCCGNPTSFPDCNHGMAMLGLLELMASQDASVDDMFTAAKYVNAFWFPQQMLQLATYLQASQHQDFAKMDARQVVSADYSSGVGFQKALEWLATNGLLEQAPGDGSRCGV